METGVCVREIERESESECERDWVDCTRQYRSLSLHSGLLPYPERERERERERGAEAPPMWCVSLV